MGATREPTFVSSKVLMLRVGRNVKKLSSDSSHQRSEFRTSEQRLDGVVNWFYTFVQQSLDITLEREVDRTGAESVLNEAWCDKRPSAAWPSKANKANRRTRTDKNDQSRDNRVIRGSPSYKGRHCRLGPPCFPLMSE